MIGIYGANGFIGRHLLDRLSARTLRIRAVSRHFGQDMQGRYGANVDLVEANLGDPIAMASTLAGVSTVIQLVSTSSPGIGNRFSVADIRDNVIPHVEFLQTCVALGVDRYVFLSSGGAVYGPTQTVPVPEDHPKNPISSHGLTKLMIEKYIQMHGTVDGLDYVILRVANAYGPGQRFRKGQGLIPAVIGRHKDGLPVQIIGNGEAKRDYVFIDDIVDAIEAAVSSAAARQSILNIGSGRASSILDVVGQMETLLGCTFAREYVGARNTDVAESLLDIGRAKSLLGWEPRHNLTDGLRRTLQSSEMSRGDAGT